jgi:hypothetical protein
MILGDKPLFFEVVLSHYSCAVLAKFEESGVGFNLGYRPYSIEEF